ncbi:branched-chain amino acid ABC transporter permease [Pikeienuella piscinae]|uniref:Branched-chain amino acid ABC transporter permease n=1 Tax=Pikeienuella piscinae TaxID=2748098 RepID=A0A7L5BVF3_9RHOB|nr:branched-chain amino acid ABC transporter permease [Pikeienuella piscinae]QIE55722.1 branched-chain amino acid ABC transporter permease [Pikeienuella piscinae]
MSPTWRGPILFAVMAAVLTGVGMTQSWSVALGIVNLCLISSIMALGVNIQWGYAGLFNVGTVGFAAVGGVAAVLVSAQPVREAWATGGAGLFLAFLAVAATVVAILLIRARIGRGRKRNLAVAAAALIGYFLARLAFDPAVDRIEAIDPALSGYLGGLGLPIVLAWPIGGLMAAGVAWLIGKVALGLRSDYLAIATLGISEIIVFIAKNEDWLTRGVKNVTGLPRPVPYEIDLQQADWFVARAASFGLDPMEASSIFVKLAYAGLFAVVLLALLWLSERALNSPWGRMMRAIRDNEEAAEAMGKDVTRRRLHAFVIGSAVCGIGGAMLTTLDGQFTPGTYNPLRFTFLIWVMVIVGGSGNNWGSVLGGFLIWFVWVEAEPVGRWLMDVLTSGMGEDNALRTHLLDSAAYMRMVLMGLILLLALRFSPKGLLPEKMRIGHRA